MKRILALIILLFISQTPTASATTPQQLPVEAFASIPDVSTVRLSPDGKQIASLILDDSAAVPHKIVALFNIETGQSHIPIKNDHERYTIFNLAWANNQTILISAFIPSKRFGKDANESILIKYNTLTGDVGSVLTKKALKRFESIPQYQHDIVDILPKDPEHILLSVSGFSKRVNEPTVIKVNLITGKTTTEQYYREHVIDWMTDQQHKVRIATYRDPDNTEYRTYEQNEANGKLRLLWKNEAYSEDTVIPIGFDVNPNILFVKAYHEGYFAVFKVDLTDPKLTKKLVYKEANHDVDGRLIHSKITRQAIGISTGIDNEYHFWDKDYQKLVSGIKMALPDTQNYLTQFSQNERRYIVFATSPTQPGLFLYGDRDARRLEVIASKYSQLNPQVLTEPKAISYQARDGLTIPSYLSLPKGIEAKKLPTIIFPHGGPQSYTGDSFDYWAQFFANRGYAVLQMNFRGSAGYGHQFTTAGLQGWGKEMQTDVEDGTRYLINEGIADPKRICIAGASYGGYAAMMGAAMTPDLYQCVISFAGVADVEDLVKLSRFYTNHEMTKKIIGDDYNALYERSPIYHADKINVPILLIHGDNDKVVQVSQSRDMYRKLDGLDKKVKYLEIDNGNHYLSNNQHRLMTFKAIDEFLSKNL
ncbi:S9 family peptidase [Shewanella sp. 1_MG-2023]|uniref:alpha/beta hydrolase family protein n=1 Tax=unclassified Shewanella TaxID=196818 RepID=UPI0026E3351D|nr:MULTISPECIES: S9 family peptidase [unclassified Shewanella]MDO6612087.1 S9 family peptidase [Shewanella sp. 7_MG-2023]MDO6771837.1 S9 family peptidase [Shewanella sp. 2_MG-2023]MDO6794181.1 S9 family peptidase [Shewanella sp. 1_MG-2023]